MHIVYSYFILNFKLLVSAPYMFEVVSQLGGAHDSVHVNKENTQKCVSHSQDLHGTITESSSSFPAR